MGVVGKEEEAALWLKASYSIKFNNSEKRCACVDITSSLIVGLCYSLPRAAKGLETLNCLPTYANIHMVLKILPFYITALLSWDILLLMIMIRCFDSLRDIPYDFYT